MLAVVTNFGRPRVFPSCQGNLWLNRLTPIEVRDPNLIKQLQNYSKRRDIQLEVKVIEEVRADYSKFKIQQLRSMASAKGISGVFKLTKKILIEKLEEKNGIS